MRLAIAAVLVLFAGACSDSDEPNDSPSSTTQPATSRPSATAKPSGSFEPHVVMQGEFEGADDFHYGEGKALLIETAPGVYTLRFEDFSVREGPDVYVILSPDADGYDEAGLDLGQIKGTDGAFNYDLPAGTEVSQFESAVIWCRAFEVLFATATFIPT